MILTLFLLLVLGPTRAPEAEAPMLLREAGSVTLMEEARSQLMDLRLEDGEATLYRLASRADGAPAAYYHLTTSSLLKILLSDQAGYYDEFFVRSDSLREVLEGSRASVWRDHLLAQNDLHRSLAWAKRGDYVRAAMAAVGSYRQLRRLADEHPEFEESYLGLGVMHATIGALPSGYRRFLRVFGFGGTLDQGFRELQRAASYSRFHREEALVFLATLDVFGFSSGRDAIETYGSLQQAHPRSPLFALLYGDALLKRRRVAEAVVHLAEANADADRPGGSFRVNYADYYLAEAHFRQDEFEEAIPLFRRYLTEHSGPSLKAVGWLHLGEALELSGRRKEAEQAYRTVVAAREFDSDAAAARSATVLLQSPLDARGRLLIRSRNAFDRNDEATATRLLESILADGAATAAQRGEAWYRMGRVLDEAGHAEAAAPFYTRAAEAPGDVRAKWAPFSLYYIGRLHAAAGRIDAARIAYRKVVDYPSEYDFRGTMEKRAQMALDAL